MRRFLTSAAFRVAALILIRVSMVWRLFEARRLLKEIQYLRSNDHCKLSKDFLSGSCDSMNALSHFSAMYHFYTPWKRSEAIVPDNGSICSELKTVPCIHNHTRTRVTKQLKSLTIIAKLFICDVYESPGNAGAATLWLDFKSKDTCKATFKTWFSCDWKIVLIL